MEADKLFKELGFNKIEFNNELVVIYESKFNIEDKQHLEIVFNKSDLSWHIDNYIIIYDDKGYFKKEYKPYVINSKLYYAINEKINEIKKGRKQNENIL